MKKPILAALLTLFFISSGTAQDTITVETLTFDDITKRRGWYNFPSDTIEFQKILMYYTLKCDAATTQDNFSCGEWDYTTYTNLYQHQNIGVPRYQLNGGYPDTINYVTEPIFNIVQTDYETIVYDNVISESEIEPDPGTTSSNLVFTPGQRNGKAQFIWTQSELIGAGLTPGTVDKIKLNFPNGCCFDNLIVRMKNSNLNDLNIIGSSFETEGFETVFDQPFCNDIGGWQEIGFVTPFEWDGTSSVVIEFCFNQAEPLVSTPVWGSQSASLLGVRALEDDGAIDFEWGDYVSVPEEVFAEIDSAITVSFWSYGDQDVLPSNTYIFEGRDESQQRVVNVHLPWSNSRVYWDAGSNGGNSFDRIDKEANTEDFEGQWNHWAFTKDVATGSMKIYLNGELWHSANGKTKRMYGITNFSIGGQAFGFGQYDGAVNEFAIWNKALDQETIQSFMYTDIYEGDADYEYLQAYYRFDEINDYVVTDFSGNDNHAQLIGVPSPMNIDGCSLYRKMENIDEIRPNVIFVDGEYESHIEIITVDNEIMVTPTSIVEYSTELDINNPAITQIPVDTIFVWESGYTYVIDNNGIAIDSTFVPNTAQLINEYRQDTYQIQNYVTPYGINLSLGSQGFRWVYDVTDYGPLLHDLVEISAGNQQELIDLKFIFIKGTPARDVLDIQSLWLGDYQHADIANDVVMPAVDVDLMPEASSFRVKTRTSGHWFGGFQNCAEFCPKLHHVKVNGNMEFEWNNWKECADNPVIAQGGTWIYDRAGWCPGAFTDTYDHEITPFVSPGETVSLDYGMQVTPNGMEGNYRVTMQLVSYGENNFTLDAAIHDIITPNDWEFYSKINPICADPTIEIQNTGTTLLTSATITYNVMGGESVTYEWSGNLAFLETEEVVLPIPGQSFWTTELDQDIFEVNIGNPNGAVDEYEGNNYAKSTFEKPEIYSGLFMLRIATNNAGSENSYTIKDELGNVVMSRSSMSSGVTYTDTIFMEDGCYVLDFLDSGEDGMSFFANNDGNGSVRFKSIPNNWQHIFNPKFGKFFKHHFIIDNTVGINENQLLQNVAIYPNPSEGVFNIRANGMEDGEVVITLQNSMGQIVTSEIVFVNSGVLKYSLDVTNQADGVYIIQVFTDQGYMIKSIIKQ